MLRQRLAAYTASHLVLGAWNPALVHQALRIDPRAGALLLCSVVIRDADGHTAVYPLDPHGAVELTRAPQLARHRRRGCPPAVQGAR